MDAQRPPYRTAPGSEPPELAGRESELAAARFAIDMAAEGEAPNPIVFLGMRGMGKTALLRDVATSAAAAGGLTLLAEADRDLRFADVMRDEIERGLKRSRSTPVKLRKALEAVANALPKIAYELPHDAGAASITGGGSRAEDAPLDELESTILRLNAHLHEHGRFLMIGLDEIQEASRMDLLRIVRAVHRTAGTREPILFFGAGLPSTPAILHDVRTYTERWAKYRLDLLDRYATFAAVERPAEKLGVRWTRPALEEIYDVSRGYPYFVQQYALAAWIQATRSPIEKSHVAAVVPGVRSLLDSTLYEPVFSSLTPREASFVLALHALGEGSHRLEGVAERLGVPSSAMLGSTKARLQKKDVVFSSIRGRVEFRLPLSNEYVTRKRAQIEAMT